jgi:hypothetical protein
LGSESPQAPAGKASVDRDAAVFLPVFSTEATEHRAKEEHIMANQELPAPRPAPEEWTLPFEAAQLLLIPTIRVSVDPGDGDDREVFWFADKRQRTRVANGYFDPDRSERDYVIFINPDNPEQSARFESEEARILRSLGADGGTESNSAGGDEEDYYEENDIDYVDADE